MKTLLKTGVLALGLAAAQGALAWGATGHRVVAQLAEQHLTPEAKAGVAEIIGERNLLAEVANWPDHIRSDYETWGHTTPWHYISIDDHEHFGDDLERSDKGDILEALGRFEAVLRDDDASAEERKQALAFYVHFVGDIHQPLHVGNRTDRGGNDVKVKYFGKPSNLHRVWDEDMINKVGLSYSEYVLFLDDVIAEEQAKLTAARYVDWAQESKDLREQVYTLETDRAGEADIRYKYNYWNRDTMDQRLRKAGYRLAGKLNEIFAD